MSLRLARSACTAGDVRASAGNVPGEVRGHIQHERLLLDWLPGIGAAAGLGELTN